MSSSVLSVRLDDDLKSKLEQVARDTGQPVEFYIHAAIADYLEEREYELALREEVEKYRSGESELGSWDELKKRLDLD